VFLKTCNTFTRTIDCYQQLEQYDVAEKAIQSRLDKYNQGSVLAELGYNFKKKEDEAVIYDKAIERIKKTQMKFMA
jgi:FPC/CPF motif-containing protein YcgG